MPRRILAIWFLLLSSVPAFQARGNADNAASALGFVSRIQSHRNVAVVTSLSGSFPLNTRIRFLDEQGNLCATGIVRSSYSDLSYIDLETGSADRLKKGFVACSPDMEGDAKVLCRFSMNLPLIFDRGEMVGQALPPNSIVIQFRDSRMKPVFFRHYLHDFGCRTCHHHDLSTPCRQCHPTVNETAGVGTNPVRFAYCVWEKCIGCHRDLADATDACARCHR